MIFHEIAYALHLPGSAAQRPPGALGAVPELSGTASGLSGFLGTAIAVTATQGAGLLSDSTPVSVAATMVALAAAWLRAALIAFRPSRA